jgi:dipeptidase E
MKLFLSSIAISPALAPAFIELVGKPAADIKIALIENAADGEQGEKDWVASNREEIIANGFQVDVVDLTKYLKDNKGLANILLDHDVVWLGGGNTYYLRWILKATGADKIITDAAKDDKIVYGGGSAGAVVAGPTLKYLDSADPPEDAPELILDGLWLTDFVVVPHSDDPQFGPLVKVINEKLQADTFKTEFISDAQAVVVNGDDVKIVP